MEILIAIIVGSLFGFVLYWVGAASPKKLVPTLRLEDLSLMKIILFAIGFSSLLLALANIIGIFNLDNLDIKTMNLAVIVGGLLFGVGFGAVGTCPGTCIAASGSGALKKGISVIIGGLFGALALSLTYGWWVDIGLYDTLNLGSLTLFNLADEYPSVFQVSYFGLLISGLFLMAIAYILPQKKAIT